MLNWRFTEEIIPADGQQCLTYMKYGLLSGEYDAEANEFSTYLGQEFTWYATKWVPIEDAL